MNKINKLVSDFWGLRRICGFGVAMKWMFQFFAHFEDVLRRGDLQTVDHAMGSGPFKIRLKQYGVKFNILGPRAISGIREMYVRDVYLRHGWLRINNGDVVVDLGANMGNFSNLALASGSNVRVVAVEPSSGLNAVFSASIAINSGHEGRVQLIRGFLGKACKNQILAMSGDSNYSDAPWISEEELIERTEINRIDFLKCDIEGGEFGLLTPSSKLLSMARSIAVEVHSFAGNVDEFIVNIKSCGFIVGPIQRDPDGSVTLLAKRA